MCRSGVHQTQSSLLNLFSSPRSFPCLCIIDNAALQLKPTFWTPLYFIQGLLFATNAARAIHQQVLSLASFIKSSATQLFTESIYVWQNGIFEMTHLTFVVIAHVNDYGVRVLGWLLNSSAFTCCPILVYVKVGIINAIGNVFFLMATRSLKNDFPLSSTAIFKTHIL